MPFRVPGEDDFNGQGFGTLKADEYRVRIKSYKVKEGAENVSQYNPEGKPTVWYTLEPLSLANFPDDPMLDTEDQPINPDKTLIFFFSPYSMGLKPVVSKSRKFFASAMQIPNEQPVEFDSEKALYDTLVGRELIVAVGINKKGKNEITDSRPVPIRRSARQSQPEPPADSAVAAATEILGATPLEGEDAF